MVSKTKKEKRMKKSLFIVLSLVMLGLMSCDGTGSGASNGNNNNNVVTGQGIPTSIQGIWGCSGEIMGPGTGVRIRVTANSIYLVGTPDVLVFSGITTDTDQFGTHLVSGGQRVAMQNLAGAFNITGATGEHEHLNTTWFRLN